MRNSHRKKALGSQRFRIPPFNGLNPALLSVNIYCPIAGLFELLNVKGIGFFRAFDAGGEILLIRDH
jgi:hypothetical protein